jgi:hypothetical protein
MTDIEKAEYDDVVRKLVAKCEELAAENARLRSSENTAHSVLREIYNDPAASPNVRVLAARAAIGHESAPLKPQPSPLDLVAEEYKPLHQVVEERRARARVLLATDPKYKDLPKEIYSSKGGEIFVYRADDDGNGDGQSS